jgi:hypothetical protein
MSAVLLLTARFVFVHKTLIVLLVGVSITARLHAWERVQKLLKRNIFGVQN